MLRVEPTLPVPIPLIEDLDLVLASKAGDVAAFGELVARYDRKLLRIALHITHNLEDAQDVVQETFLKVFQNLDAFRGDSKFSTWLFRIAVNQSLMGLRKQRTKQRAGVEFPLDSDEEGNLPLDLSDWRPNPEELYKTSELRKLLTEALHELSPALRVVFVLHDVEGHRRTLIARNRRRGGRELAGGANAVTAGQAAAARATDRSLQKRSELGNKA